MPNLEQFPQKIFPCRGKSLTRKDLFWPLGESHHLPFWEGLCPSEKLSAIAPKILSASRTLCLWVSLFVQSSLLSPRMPAAPSRSPNLARSPTFGACLRATCDPLWTFKGQNKRNFRSFLERPWRTLSHRQDSTQNDTRLQQAKGEEKVRAKLLRAVRFPRSCSGSLCRKDDQQDKVLLQQPSSPQDFSNCSTLPVLLLL